MHACQAMLPWYWQGAEAFDMTKRVVEPLLAQFLGGANMGQGYILELQLNVWQGPWQPPFVIMNRS